ncbi:molecular chaperone HscC [Salmonella enterica subsp. enterica]|uniref:Molecular chaperone HscC n=1 Tax=Salmonella enterica subsp. enterica serovar Macclesfield str. S-1643 TaxID=1242107 RepID=A0A2C9P2F5_SALET|nr:molecular chaperone HscC [Salmonella enterica]EAA5485949.1 molecular chaperone HscC [Salmonella enterica subsp. enterica serovar Kouka]EBG2394217.1 molecular chaperone HscC [Salmonella enterica subsp. enterica serovar Everleigh]EBS1108774.1 molecular chaperone HscC [Salmonella enterica subsp. enterica serovar Eingedi]ECH9261454.1 molecular chaperone HscC [Salmonella enterica subsp. enterica]ASG17544.1 molecular chaperone HscC [Salmonella enterica subsp. enterica serovar Macclesfield str. S-
MDNATLAIGIDLGTTNSLIAVWQDGAAQLIPNKFGEYLTPSIISMDENKQILVGKPAAARKTSHPDKTAALFKRAMGSHTLWHLGEESFNAPELSSLVLRSLKEDAEDYLQQPIKDVVISVPAYFSDEQRKHTRLAAELAGLNAVRLINEPTAAAMAYDLHTQQNSRSLVFDLGGGTFDVTVLEYATPIIEVHASAGDNYLGGEDFTHLLLDEVLKRWNLDKSALTDSDLAALYACVEAAKCASGSPLRMSWLYQERALESTFYDDELEALWLPLLNRLRTPIEQALRDSRLKPEQIDSLVLVGGASQMPLVQRIAVRLFGKLPYQSYDPSTIVALGAATQAACRLRHEDVEEVILTDICPYSLGVEVNRQGVPGIFSPIIERNTTVPVSKVETYSTMHPEQDSICVRVYQGESHKVKNNILIDSFDVMLKPNGHIQAIDIRFSYDINGLLEVDVLLEDGKSESRIISHNATSLTTQQIEASRERLQALKIYPRDMLINRTFKAQLEEQWSRALGDEREMLGEIITDFDAALLSNDMQRVDDVRRRACEYLGIDEPKAP